MSSRCNQARGYELDEQFFVEQGMELNSFYSRKEMKTMGFQIC